MTLLAFALLLARWVYGFGFFRGFRRGRAKRKEEDVRETVIALARIGTPQLVRDEPSDDEHATSYEDRMG